MAAGRAARQLLDLYSPQWPRFPGLSPEVWLTVGTELFWDGMVGSAPSDALAHPLPQSKGGILSKACDYIRELRQTNQRMQETFKEAERLRMDNELLRQQVRARAGARRGLRASAGSLTCALSRLQIEELKNENALLRAQLQQHNLEMVGESTRQ